MFHEQLVKLETLWGVEVDAEDGSLGYVDTERTDDWDGDGKYDAWPDENGKLQFETFDWWGK